MDYDFLMWVFDNKNSIRDVNSVVVRDVASVSSSRVWGVYSESVDSWPAA